jgi:cytidylate kinase
VTASGPVVAIDGPAGSGKSTLAERLAKELGLPYLNTGLMYRALTARVLQSGLDVNDEFGLAESARAIRFDLDEGSSPPTLLIDGLPPDQGLVSAEVERSVSAVSRHRAVREVLVSEQRRLGGNGVVMEGRDIGSVVFPDADVKLFLEAAPAERARRRGRERGDAAAEAAAGRDSLDARVNPFVAAPGAIVIETTGRPRDDVYAEALRAVRSEVGG